MKHHAKKLAAILLSAIMVLSIFPAAAFAADRTNEESMTVEANYGYTPFTHPGSRAITNAYLRGDMETYARLSGRSSNTRDTIPSSYDSRNYNYITSVKNQNPYGTCWAFGTMAPIEAYMIKHGIINGDTGAAATTSMDLSEYHLAWFTYTNAYDAEGMLTGDKSTAASSYLDLGGNGALATLTLMRWEGTASEANSALGYSNASSSGLNSQYAYAYNNAHVVESIWINASDRNAVKEAIMEYGAGTISYYHSDTYLNTSTYAYNNPSSTQGNHAVTVVGWDDNYAVSNFKSSYRPSNPGAWIIKNSWGSSWGKSGYFYLSYEDLASSSDDLFFYKVSTTDNYDHNYQWDGTIEVSKYQGLDDNSKIANVFTANGAQILKAVAVNMWDEAVTYTLEIYKNPTNSKDPTSGTLMTSQNGYFPHYGYLNVPLENPVSLSEGDKFAVVFTMSTPEADSDDNKYIHPPYDSSGSVSSFYTTTHVNHGDTSFYKEPSGSWTDCPDNGDFRIKAYTDDVTFTVDAVSNNTNYGTVSVSGTTITAAPAAGYYVSGYEVISGSATCTINGNMIYVAPESNCTIRVIFSLKPTYTVNFVASGTTEGSQSALIYDTITLPSSVSVNPDGWTFSGWVNSQFEETTEAPEIYAPGASYTVTANTTLYAVYTRVEEGTGDPYFELLTAAPADWAGNYVISYGTDSSLYVMKGVTVSSNGAQIESNSNAAALSASGMTLNGNKLENVANTYIFNVAASGSYYTIRSASTNVYVGETSSNYLGGYNTYSSGYCDWTLGTMTNASSATCVNGGDYPYLSYNPSSNYFWTQGNNGISNGYVYNIRWWKETNGSTTYYWTDPVVAEHEHVMEYAAAVAPTCGAEGHTAYYHCTVCGKYFSDANGENEITLASTVIPATGNHSWGAWTSNNDGTHKHTCSVCGAEESVACTYTDEVVAPTATEQGYTLHTCTVCGYNYKDTYTAPLGNDFTVHFSVPAGVTKPADMVSNTNTGITLPTVTGPEGYTFLGWVTEDYDNVETRPATILTGNYIAPQEITLKALFTYVDGEGSGETVYQLTDTLEDGGKYIIIDSNSISGTSGYAMGNTIVANSHYLNAVSVTVNSDDTVTASNVANILWEAAQGTTGFTLWNAAVGKYAGLDSGQYLYPSATALEWAYTSEGYLDNQIDTDGYYYLSFSTSDTRYTTNTAGKVINFYAETTVGTSIYTTIIGEEHVHTPGSPVTENVVDATCTAAGSYDTVVYCTECGEELSRETTTVPALGHNPQAAVVENNQEPSCTVSGGYDNVVYCGRCNAELSREHVEVTALGHLPGEAVRENYVEPTVTDEGGYDMVVYCQRCNAELSREHTVLPATGPIDPIELTSLRVFRNVSIGTDMLITFSILESNLTDYDSWYIQVTKDGLEGTETYRFGPEACSLANGTYAVDFTHISAKEMGVMYHAQVFAMKDGVAYCGPVREGTMKQYLASTLTSTDSSVSATLKTLAADMLNYGAAAQTFLDYDTEHLVNVELSETELTALHNYETTGEASATKTNTNTVPTGEPRLLYTSVAMTNRVELGLFVNLNNLSGWQDAESIEVQMKDHETQQVVAVMPTVLNANGTQMDASFPGIGAKNMRTEYDFVTLVDGVERGNIRTWSIEGYVNQLRNDNSSSDALKALANAVLIYGDSAQRYLDAQ